MRKAYHFATRAANEKWHTTVRLFLSLARCLLCANSGLRGAAKYCRRPLPSAQKAHEVAELLHRRALYRVYAELRVLLTNLDGRLKRWGIECCLRLLKVFKSEQDYALGWLAFD